MLMMKVLKANSIFYCWLCPSPTRVENLTAWWSFDEGNGTTVTDYMNGFVVSFTAEMQEAPMFLSTPQMLNLVKCIAFS